MTPDDRETDLRPSDELLMPDAATKPLPPLAKGRTARHDAIVTRVVELTTLTGMPAGAAAAKALGELDRAEQPLPVGSKVLLAVFAVIVLVVLLPLAGYAVGHWLIPLWWWGFGWVN